MDENTKPKISKMSLDMLKRRIFADPDWAMANKDQIVDHLGNIAWDVGKTWDWVNGTDPTHGPERRYGTRNRRSMTYKLRKAANFSYP